MELQPFDLLFVYGKTWIGRAICRLTNSPYSHVAIALDAWHIAETDWRTPLQVRHLWYRTDEYDVYRYQGMLTATQQAAMRQFVESMLRTRYDTLQSLTNGLHLLTGLPIKDAPNRLNCSETVDRMFAAAGIDLVPGALGKVSPADLSRSEKLLKVS
jgi:hypothetical protein